MLKKQRNFTGTTLGSPVNDTSAISWSGAYTDVDESDTWTGSISVDIRDQVNNSNGTYYTVSRDTTNPEVTLTPISDGATGPENITATSSDNVWVSDVYLYIKNMTGNTHWNGNLWTAANVTLLPGNISSIRSSTTDTVDVYYNCNDNGVTWGYNTYEVGMWPRDAVNNTDTVPQMDKFTLSAPDTNNAPTQSNPGPSNGSYENSITPTLNVTCSDSDAADTLNATWWSNSSDAWIQFGSNNTSFASGANIMMTNSNFSGYNETYYWSVNLTDGEGGWNNETYHFTTVNITSVSLSPATWSLGKVWVDDTNQTTEERRISRARLA